MNVILITIDCLRADRLAIKGADAEIAPYLNQLTRKGHFFTNAFSNGPYTYASFPSILTGAYASIHGDADVLDPSIKTLAQLVSEKGYFTAGINSNPYLSTTRNYGKGFDVFVEFPEWSNENSYRKGQKLPYARGERVNKKAEEVLLQSNQERPFFLWLHYMDLHVPFSPFMTILTKFLSSNLIKRNRHLYGPGSLAKNFTIKDKDVLVGINNACLNYCDKCIKNLLEEILGPEITKNSLVIITSDHGEAFYEHGRFGHYQALYDELLKVPLLVIAPHLKKENKRGKISQPVSLIDIPPTVADFIGIKAIHDWCGKSLLTYTEDSEVEAERIVYASCKLNKEKLLVSARDKRWKLIFNEVENSHTLYDIASDPSEKKDVKSFYPEIMEKLRKDIDSFLLFVRKNRKKPTEVVETDEVKARLKALGYLD